MIYHLLLPQRLHLSPGIIKSYLNVYDKSEHVFILYKCETVNIATYEAISEEYNINLIYIQNLSEVSNIIQSKDDPILFHSLNEEWLVYLVKQGYNNINIVNWGHIPSLRRPKYLIYLLLHPCLVYSYNKIRTMVALMEPDRSPLQKFFRNTKVITIAYLGNTKRQEYIEACLVNPNTSSGNVVYVGNNSSCLKDYLYIARKVLYKFKDRIKALYMLNYFLDKNELYQQLLSINKEYSDATTDEEMRPLDEYVKVMNDCDIYICSRNRQTGLGAIHTTLQLGKKLYLDGPNYSYVHDMLNCKVFHVKDIDGMTYEEFIKPLSNEEKLNNKTIVENVLSDEILKEKWDHYFKLITNDNI